MKILFYGDSITDMGRDRNCEVGAVSSYGVGYPIFVAEKLFEIDPLKWTIVNRGISGNRIVDLYARIKADVWNHNPDVLSILIGINDIWHELGGGNGVDLERFERIYDMLLSDTKERLPDLKIILMEPFVLKGQATAENMEFFKQIYSYAEVVKKLAEKHGAYFLPLQKKLNDVSEKYGVDPYLYDGVHPNIAGAGLIACEWLKLFKEKIDK